jgi:hypothetical protein
MRRGDYILMLYRAAGEPDVSGACGFTDVPEDAYFAAAIAWAWEAGIVDDAGGDSFEPMSPVSRQQAFTFTYRALGVLDKQFADGTAEDLERFPDADLLDDYAVIPTATLISLGIIEGSDGRLIPHNTLTRAQMAKVLAMVLQLP